MLPAERKFPRRRRFQAVLAAGLVAVGAWSSAGLALAAPAAPAPARVHAHAGGHADAGVHAAVHPRPRGAKTVVTFGWGGGLASQMQSLPMFRKYGMHATYFIPSGLVCAPGQSACGKSSPYLTLADVHKIAAYGNEIGGLSVTHQQLNAMPVTEAKREVCQDRSNLIRWGFRPTDFAYPFAIVNPALEALTRACGYNAGLGAGTLKGAGVCNNCAVAETIPPKDPFNVQTPVEVNSAGTTWTPRTYESIVMDARRHGGGWVIFTLHDLCGTNCNLGTSRAILAAVLKWLHGQERRNVTVKTMSQVIGGRMRPAVAGPAPRALRPPGVANADLTQAKGATPACFQQVAYGGTRARFAYRPGGGPKGSAAETVRVTRSGSGNAMLVPTMDLGLCTPSVSPGHAYAAGAWYKSDQQTHVVVYRRTSIGDWIYWATSPSFPASTSWRQVSWSTPAVPPGTTALSFGLTASAGTISTADYSLKLAKSYKSMVLLGILLFVIVAAGLIARGYYRYAKYMKAEAAGAEAEPALEEAEPVEAEPVTADNDATVVMQTINPGGTRKATGGQRDWLPTDQKTARPTR